MALPTLTLGNFELTDFAGATYGVSVIAEGTSRGAPVPINVAVKSWLQDGSVVVTQGFDNRDVTLRVRLRGPGSGGAGRRGGRAERRACEAEPADVDSRVTG